LDSKYLLALNAHPKIGGQTIKKILSVFPDARLAWSVDKSDLVARLGEKLADLVVEAKKLTDPDREIEKLANLGIGYITIYDKKYPKLLSQIYDSPAVLYVKGEINVLNSVSLAIVGSRKYSDYGKSACYDLAKDCAQNNLTIVSGLALGIDTFAHQAAVDCQKPTIAVLGCGVDQVYPASNNFLAKKILEFGGAIISEFPPGTAPFKQNFPARNRIIAGLSSGVLVIEAAESSGALITAYQGLEYNREIFAVPGNINSPTSAGTNKLIKEGAVLVSNANDILVALNLESNSDGSKQVFCPEGEHEIKVCEILSKGIRTVDEIIKESNLNVISLSTALTMLEMKNIVQNVGSGQYRLIAITRNKKSNVV
jgi:DNA processing protein